MKLKLLPLVISGLMTTAAFGDNAKIEEITIVGELNEQRQIAGSAHYLGPEELNKHSYSDIQRVLRQIPGVSLHAEKKFFCR